jgi:hypothetical protein
LTQAQTLNREKKVLGHEGVILKTAVDIIDHLPEKFKKSSTGSPLLQYMYYVNPAKTKPMMTFM